jgi:hypothetical protein
VLNFQKACLGRDKVRLDSVALWGDSLITRARQGLVTQLLGHPSATHLLFIDGNVGFAPGQVFRLIEFDADIAAAAVPRNGGETGGNQDGKGTNSTEPTRIYEYEQVGSTPEDRKGFVRAKAAGTGMMLIKRSALKAMVEKHSDLRYKSEFSPSPADPRYWSYALFNCLIDGDRGFLSEDESFSLRWIQMGGEIWVDLESALKGMGPTVFHGK